MAGTVDRTPERAGTGTRGSGPATPGDEPVRRPPEERATEPPDRHLGPLAVYTRTFPPKLLHTLATAVTQTLRSRLEADLKEARKARDRERTVLLTTTLSEIRNREIDERKTLEDDDVVEVIARGIKQRRDSAQQYRDAGREELAEKEEREAERLQDYLPEQLEEDEVRGMVREIVAEGADGIGPVMGRLMPRIKGRFDGKEANRIVREELHG